MSTMPLPSPPNGLTQVALRALRRLRGYNPAADLDLTAREASERVFCFAGEFGYELISWLPYLLDLKRHVDLRLVTYGRPGSKVFYNFSDEHHEFGVGVVGNMWGDLATYAALQASLGARPFVFPRAKRNIRVEGRSWRTRDIHKEIPNDAYYEPLDYSSIRLPTPFRFERPFVVLNNKFTAEWGGPPTNFFGREELIALREFLIGRGYAVVYNHFREKTRTNKELGFDLDDSGIFGAIEYTYDLSDEYRRTNDIGERNRMQLSIYNQAAFVVAPQGGSCYLPAICRRDLVMLMRIGDYIDYRELGRVYGVRVDVFYEVPHMLAWLAQRLDARRA
jgi:hypothetical protein